MVNKSDPIGDKLSRLSEAVDKMKVGEIILPTQLFRPLGINPVTGVGWYNIHETLSTFQLKPLFNTQKEISAFQKTDEQELDSSRLILKKLNEIEKDLKELKEKDSKKGHGKK
jgi:hypothetical protein